MPLKKGVNHGWTRMNTDKNAIRTKATDGPDYTAEAQRRREENGEKENVVIPGS
jgi:hypothetical protein